MVLLLVVGWCCIDVCCGVAVFPGWFCLSWLLCCDYWIVGIVWGVRWFAVVGNGWLGIDCGLGLVVDVGSSGLAVCLVNFAGSYVVVCGSWGCLCRATAICGCFGSEVSWWCCVRLVWCYDGWFWLWFMVVLVLRWFTWLVVVLVVGVVRFSGGGWCVLGGYVVFWCWGCLCCMLLVLVLGVGGVLGFTCGFLVCLLVWALSDWLLVGGFCGSLVGCEVVLLRVLGWGWCIIVWFCVWCGFRCLVMVFCVCGWAVFLAFWCLPCFGYFLWGWYNTVSTCCVTFSGAFGELGFWVGDG